MYGLVGSRICDLSQKYPIHSIYCSGPSNQCDLKDLKQIKEIINWGKPDAIIHCASKVAGIGGHKFKHYKFFHDNCLINSNIIQVARENSCKLIALNSVAAYPANLPLLQEDLINTGPVHESEKGYALSKRHLDDLIQLSREDGYDFCSVFPTNIYGPNDNFHLENAHVIASLIHKWYLMSKGSLQTFYGDGRSLRQFIYVDDLVQIIFKLLELENLPDRLICANPCTYTIKEVSEIIRKLAGVHKTYEYFEGTKNGLRVRECDITRLIELAPTRFTNLEDGLAITYNWFKEHYPKVRK